MILICIQIQGSWPNCSFRFLSYDSNCQNQVNLWNAVGINQGKIFFFFVSGTFFVNIDQVGILPLQEVILFICSHLVETSSLMRQVVILESFLYFLRTLLVMQPLFDFSEYNRLENIILRQLERKWIVDFDI